MTVQDIKELLFGKINFVLYSDGVFVEKWKVASTRFKAISRWDTCEVKGMQAVGNNELTLTVESNSDEWEEEHCLYSKDTLERAKEIAKRIHNPICWDLDAEEELVTLAGFKDEWDSAGNKDRKNILSMAAKKLRVELF